MLLYFRTTNSIGPIFYSEEDIVPLIPKLQNIIIKNAKRYQIFFMIYGILGLFNVFFGIYALYKKGYPAIAWFYQAMIGFFFIQTIICIFTILALSIIRKPKIEIN